MRLTLLAGLVAVAGVALAAGTTEYQTAVKLYRGLSIIAASDPNHRTYRPDFTLEVCRALKTELGEAEKETRDSGQATYKCQVEERDIIAFHPAPTPTCPEKPADEQQQLLCPAGTVGTWLQDRVWTLQPYPDCWVQGDWTPAEPPEGMCAPDTPPEPEVLPAPTNVRAEGVSTSSNLVRWDAVAGAASYSVRRCIGSTCEPMDRDPLICAQGLEQHHVTLPAGLTVSYRVQASAAADCSNPGAPSDPIARGTTLTETTPEPQPTPAGTATLRWTPPTQNTDGSSLTNLAGYYIAYGLSQGALTQSIQVPNPGQTSYTIGELAAGTYYFAVRAYTSSGTESGLSNVVSKLVQ